MKNISSFGLVQPQNETRKYSEDFRSPFCNEHNKYIPNIRIHFFSISEYCSITRLLFDETKGKYSIIRNTTTQDYLKWKKLS